MATVTSKSPGLGNVRRSDLPYVDVTLLPNRVVGDGVADDTAAIQAAINAYESVFFPSGTYNCGAIELPDRDVRITSDGAVINGTSGTHIFRQRKRGNLFRCSGVDFTGDAIAFNYDSDDVTLPYVGQLFEYHIDSCKFLVDTGVKAIRLYGSREGLITGCYFEGNAGINALAGAINTKITDCQWKNCSYGVLSQLTAGVGNAEGVIISGAVMLGCGYGVRAERTTGVLISNSMLDYCDAPIYLLGATEVSITGSYISTRTTTPAIYSNIHTDTTRGSNHIISENHIRDNYSTTGSACMEYVATDWVDISNNVLGNYASYGIKSDDCTFMNIAGNAIRNRSGLGTNSILVVNDSSTVAIRENRLAQALSRTIFSTTRSNAGFTTEASGEAVISTGTDNVVVTHGLAFTPSKTLIFLTPTTPNTKDLNYFVSAVTSTTFTITVDAGVGGTTAFAWQVRSAP